MLAYVRRRWFEARQGAATQPPPKKRRGRQGAAPARQPAAQPAAPPESAKSHVENLDAEHAVEKADWTEGKEALEESVRRRREAYERLFGGVNTATPARVSSDGVVPEFNGDIALLETDALEAWVAGVAPKGAAKTGAADENGVVNMAEDSDDDDATAVVNEGGVVWADAETGALPRVKRLVRAPRLCER